MGLSTPLSAEVIARARALEVRARNAVRVGLGGRWRTSHRGSGVEFADVRDYVLDDDARIIDWNVSARSGRLKVKRLEEDREQAVFFLLDRGVTALAAGGRVPWRTAAAEFVALAGVAAAQSGDRVGAGLFGRVVERVVDPRHGVAQAVAIAAQVLACDLAAGESDLDGALTAFRRVTLRPALLFVVSPFPRPPEEGALAALARRHDVVLVALRGGFAAEAKPAGWLSFVAGPAGRRWEIDLEDEEIRAELERRMAADRAELARRARRCGADLVQLHTDEDAFLPLRAWCERRSRMRT